MLRKYPNLRLDKIKGELKGVGTNQDGYEFVDLGSPMKIRNKNNSEHVN
jgi:hypothetical protein